MHELFKKTAATLPLLPWIAQKDDGEGKSSLWAKL
jgi:hypothetical protein